MSLDAIIAENHPVVTETVIASIVRTRATSSLDSGDPAYDRKRF